MDRIGCKCHASNPRRARSEHGPGQVSTHPKCLALHTQKDIGEWDSTAQGETGRRTRLGTAHSPSFLRSSIAIRRWVRMDVWTNNNSTSTVYAPLDQQKEKKKSIFRADPRQRCVQPHLSSPFVLYIFAILLLFTPQETNKTTSTTSIQRILPIKTS